MARTEPDLSAHARPFSHTSDSPVGIMVSHGFTSTPASMMPLARALAGAGYNVELPCLTGHGQTLAQANRARYTDWQADVERAYSSLKARCGTVFAAGLSMGGALSLSLALEHPELAGLILVNHGLFLKKDPMLALVPVVKYFLSSVPAIAGDLKDPEAREPAYDRTPVKAVHELLKLLAHVRGGLAGISQPLLIFKSRDDHVLPFETGTYTMDRVSSTDKELIILENSFHVATLDYDKDLITDRSLEFIDRLSG